MRNITNKNLYVCRTYYNVLISLIKAYYDGCASVIVIEDFRRRLFGNRDELVSRLKTSKLFEDVFVLDSGDDDYFVENNEVTDEEQLSHLVGKIKSMNFDFLFKNKRYDSIVLYNDWDSVIAKYIRLKKLKYMLCEASENAFQVMFRTTPSVKKFESPPNADDIKMHKVTDEAFLGAGRSNLCERIEVNSLEKLPDYVNDKVRVLNKREFFSGLDADIKLKIKDVFLGKSHFNYPKKKSVLLLTRPFSGSDGWLPSEEIHKKLILAVLKRISEDMNIYVKPHPRDTFDYKYHFPYVTVYDRFLPIEALAISLGKMRFKKTISIGTSCVDSIDLSENNIILDLNWFINERNRLIGEEESEKLNSLV